MQTSKGTENLMSDNVYNQVTKEISDIRSLVDKKRAKGANQPEPTQQLVEIETHIIKIIKFIKDARRADEKTVTSKLTFLQIKAMEEK